MSRRLIVGLIAAGTLGAFGPPAASAHPLGNFSINHLTRVKISSDRVEARYILDQAEIPTFQERGLSPVDVLTKKRDEVARNLSYGDQRRLEVARALAVRPSVLLLDEPTAGMNPRESAVFTEFVHRVRDEKDVSILLIEHDMSVIMKISERITVLDRGAMIAEGTPDDIRNNQQVIEAYLGKTGTREGKRNKT